MSQFLIIICFFMIVPGTILTPLAIIFLNQSSFHYYNLAYLAEIGEIHPTVPVDPITTRVELLPQDFVSKKESQSSYGLWWIPTILVVCLVLMMCCAFAACRRRVGRGECFLCGQ